MGSFKLVKIVFCGPNSGQSVMSGFFVTGRETNRG